MTARNLLLATALCASLAACSSGSDIRETLGMSRKAPDEFRVYSRPALTVPPEFALRAPGSVTDAPTTATASAQARSSVLGEAPTTGMSGGRTPVVYSGDTASGADAQFLQNAGARKAVPNVRSAIQEETENGLKSKDSSYLINVSADGEPVVDATKEAERLKQNKAEHKSPTAGDTPVIEPKNKGILGTLGDIF